jgi:hypothetical protein
MMYQALEGAKERLGFWIGSAKRGSVLGETQRSVVKGTGEWKSGWVDLYFREEESGVVLGRA